MNIRFPGVPIVFSILLVLAACGGGGTATLDAGNGIPQNGSGNGSIGGSTGGSDGGSVGGSVGGADGSAGAGGSASGDAGGGAGGVAGGGGGTGGTAGDGSTGGVADGGSPGTGGGIGGTGSPSTAGTVRFYLADAPSCGYDAVYVTVQKVRIHQNAAAAEGDAGWSEVTLNPARRVDLLTLTNGVLDNLGQTSLPPGRYTQLRLVLADNDGARPTANSVIPTGGLETPLETSGNTAGGIKVNADIDVAPGGVTNLVLDFDACKSVVRGGNAGRYKLKPVISVLPLSPSDAGLQVSGYVAPAISNASTKVSLQLNGTPVRATSPGVNGRFLLYPVPPGVYDLVVTSKGRATAVLTGVPVASASPTVVGSPSVRIDPPAATARSLAGTVSPSSASVRALQTLSGGPTVEVAWAPVDATTGEFGFDLPAAATLKASYAAGAAAWAFAPDPSNALQYTVEARSGAATKTQTVDVLGSVPALSFTLP